MMERTGYYNAFEYEDDDGQTVVLVIRMETQDEDMVAQIAPDLWPDIMFYVGPQDLQFEYRINDSPKMLRETLCVAQSAIAQAYADPEYKKEHVDRLQRLIDECERKRPLGRGGKHGDLHTEECGC